MKDHDNAPAGNEEEDLDETEEVVEVDTPNEPAVNQEGSMEINQDEDALDFVTMTYL
jgi:hypothetical protein